MQLVIANVPIPISNPYLSLYREIRLRYLMLPRQPTHAGRKKSGRRQPQHFPIIFLPSKQHTQSITGE